MELTCVPVSNFALDECLFGLLSVDECILALVSMALKPIAPGLLHCMLPLICKRRWSIWMLFQHVIACARESGSANIVHSTRGGHGAISAHFKRRINQCDWLPSGVAITRANDQRMTHWTRIQIKIYLNFRTICLTAHLLMREEDIIVEWIENNNGQRWLA